WEMNFGIALVSICLSFTVALIVCDRVISLGVVFVIIVSVGSYLVCRMAAHTLGIRLSVSTRLCGSNRGFHMPGKDGAVVVEAH
ncbi:hypothetical protein EDB19DRAFT_1762755, partial [Suillus lakei]